MKNKYLFFSLLLIYSSAFSQLPNFTKYVDPFIGTGGHGHTYPGAVVPFGMVQLSPDTRLSGWDGCSGYHYSDSVIYGFTHTHLSGTGCSDYGDILFMPMNNNPSPDNKKYSSAFSHKNETASPGFYSVIFNNRIKVELTATIRAGFHKYSFPDKGQQNIILDLVHRDTVLESSLKIVSNTKIEGMRKSEAWAKNQYIYFVAEFSEPFTKSGIYTYDKLSENTKESNEKSIKAYFQFNTKNKKPLLIKVGISSVSIEGARKNLEAEIPGWDFDKIKNDAEILWSKELSKIEITDSIKVLLKKFYTALYHTMIVPNVNMDVDGQYRGMDNKIHKAEGFVYYSVFSLWDTFRAAHPLYTIIDKKRTIDFIKTFLAQYDQGGSLPVWELSSNETDCMIGYHSVSVIADALIKGINNFDKEKAFEAMKKSATWNHLGLHEYIDHGYLSADDEHESVSKTLEYGYDDWCIAQVAQLLNKPDDYKNYIARAQAYKNIFDSETGFMRPRKNGNWLSPFDPCEVNNHFTEANSWQYSFFVPQDISGLINLYGGKEKFSEKLDKFFNEKSGTTGRKQNDITGLIGQYAHGNEPSHNIAYLYNFTGQPWKTQEKVHQILNEMYQSKPDGLIGNEDCGQMSAWYVMSALGFYPVTPGMPWFVIGSPLFQEAIIHFDNGTRFNIIANNASEENYYILFAMLYGKLYSKSFLTYADIMKGGTLKFEMGNNPSPVFGVKDGDFPVTAITDFPIVPVPIIKSTGKTFKKSTEISLESTDKNFKLFYTINGSAPNNKSLQYTNTIKSDTSVTISAIAVNEKGEQSKITKARFFKFPNDWKIKLNAIYNPQYSAGGDDGIIDGIRGETNWRKGEWQGYQGQDFETIIDLGKEQIVGTFSAGFLQDTRSWIIFPSKVEFSLSKDGITFFKTFECNNSIPANDYNISNKELSVQPAGLNQARYIKIKAYNFGKLPEWHQGAGGEAFIFIDEITIK